LLSPPGLDSLRFPINPVDVFVNYFFYPFVYFVFKNFVRNAQNRTLSKSLNWRIRINAPVSRLARKIFCREQSFGASLEGGYFLWAQVRLQIR